MSNDKLVGFYCRCFMSIENGQKLSNFLLRLSSREKKNGLRLMSYALDSFDTSALGCCNMLAPIVFIVRYSIAW